MFRVGSVNLKLNPEKTEFIIIGDRHTRDSLFQKFPTQLLGNSIFPTNEVKNLGVPLDSGNTFASHITSCLLLSSQGPRMHLEILQTAALLANSMNSSQIDYCNSLLYGVN